MWYELFMRCEDPNVDALEELLGSLQVEDLAGSKGYGLSLTSGRVRIVAHAPETVPLGSGRMSGFDMLIPGGASATLATEALEALWGWAEPHRWRVYDPQLGREVTRRDTDAIKARIGRLADYLTETGGLGDVARASGIDVDMARPRLTRGARFYVGLAIGLILLALFAGYC